MIQKIVLIFLGILLSALSVPVQAQSGAPAGKPVELEALFNPDEGPVEMRAVKEQIRSLLRQNEELEPQARSLKEEFLSLRETVLPLRDEVAAMEKEHARKQQRLEQRIKNISGADASQSLQQLQLYDLQYEKKELELEFQLKEIAAGEKQQAHDRRLAEFRKELDENLRQQKRLSEQADELRGKNIPLTYEIEFLKQENALLENQLRSIKASRNPDGIHQIAEYTGDPSGPAGLLRQDIRRKENEKAQLQRKIEQLEMEQKSSAGNANFSSSEAQFFEAVNRLHAENRRLRSQIFSLRQKVQAR